ncbi:hypothetical protein DM01DRAFT_1337604 [Hesseltinella vesiculosa]|uniref:Uncharacterized protein n=1 Tax=Hesseltinella vesiculosa TaxID=101127 RepID=A0A1X2GD75_9FUNG|nr:hypothetical protein DM01DRAFT_1337604 [Hesseltinella vesiculosa]
MFASLHPAILRLDVGSTHSLLLGVDSLALRVSYCALVKPLFTSLNRESVVPYNQLHVTIGNLHLPTAAGVHVAQCLLREQISRKQHHQRHPHLARRAGHEKALWTRYPC